MSPCWRLAALAAAVVLLAAACSAYQLPEDYDDQSFEDADVDYYEAHSLKQRPASSGEECAAQYRGAKRAQQRWKCYDRLFYKKTAGKEEKKPAGKEAEKKPAGTPPQGLNAYEEAPEEFEYEYEVADDYDEEDYDEPRRSTMSAGKKPFFITNNADGQMTVEIYNSVKKRRETVTIPPRKMQQTKNAYTDDKQYELRYKVAPSTDQKVQKFKTLKCATGKNWLNIGRRNGPIDVSCASNNPPPYSPGRNSNGPAPPYSPTRRPSEPSLPPYTPTRRAS